MASVPKASALAVLLLLSPATIGAQTFPDEPECGAPGNGKLELTKQDTTIFGLSIGTATLKSVEAKLGQTDILPRNGSASSSNTICYFSPTDGTVVTFGAGPMGGFVNITEFSIWSSQAKFLNRSACRASRLVSHTLSTTSGIKLGLRADQLSSIVGAQGTTHYELMCRRKMSPEEIKGFNASDRPYFDVTSFVDVQFAGSGASRIDIRKIVSY